MIRRAATWAVLLCLVTPAEAMAEPEESSTPEVFGVAGAALAGLGVFFAFEAQLAAAHEADPSETREGLSTAFTVVSISSFVLAVASLTIAVVMKLLADDPAVATLSTQSSTVRIWCPNLSCLPGAP